MIIESIIIAIALAWGLNSIADALHNVAVGNEVGSSAIADALVEEDE